MRNALSLLLADAKASLSSCRVCPVKGTCVFITPRYEPGYCLHEYKLLHAFLAQRLRVHPPAGAAGFAMMTREVEAHVNHLRATRPFDPSDPHLEVGEGFFPHAFYPVQAHLGRFGVTCA